MKNLFEQSRSHWVRYDRYELKTAADGKRYITPGKNAKPDIYNPLKAPTTTAIKVEITVANPPIRIEILPPYQIMEKISLPIVSVPKRNSLSGALL